MKYLSMKVFYVGEGDCIVLKLPDGTLGLVDSCVPPWRNATPALEYIRQQGGHLSFMCLTHPHLDHFGGMLAIAENKGIEIDEFWHPFDAGLYEVVRYKSYVWQYGDCPGFSDLSIYETRAEEFPRLMNWAKDLPLGKERCIVEGMHLRSVDDLYEIVAIAPSERAAALYRKRIRHAWETNTTVEARYENRVSAVLLIRFGNARVILGADAFSANWREILDGFIFKPDDAAHCFKAAHHGSKYGFFKRMWPSLVRDGGQILVSAGGSRLASREFVKSASRSHDLWCTGCGPFCISDERSRRFSHLDDVSDDEVGEACFEDIEVCISATGKTEVRSSKVRPRNELKCGHAKLQAEGRVEDPESAGRGSH